MKNENLWETNAGNKFYTFFDNIEDFIKYITEKKLLVNFILKEKFTCEEDSQNRLEEKAKDNNSNITYTDSLHPIAISDNPVYPSVINPTFFEEHKEEFIKCYRQMLQEDLKSNNTYLSIYSFSITEEELKKIISSENAQNINFSYHQFDDAPLSEDIINEIKTKHLEFTIYDKNKKSQKISSRKAFGFYTFDQIQNMNSISINADNINFDEINNLMYLQEDATITINSYNINNESEYFNKIKTIIDILSQHNRSYNIKFEVKNRETLRKSNLLNNLPNNINIFIQNDLYTYDLKSYLNEEEILEKMIEPIRNSNLSPFEKYLAAYNIVKQFKKYKENKENTDESRYLRYILNNEYIVCRGFANLLEALLDKLEIPCQNISAFVDLSYDGGYTMEETALNHEGHARNLVNIDDDKYNIHGFYIIDSTWDNSLNNDLYLNSLMTFDRKKEAFRLEALQNLDLILDFHNIEEFQEKIAYFIKKEINKSPQNYDNNRKYCEAYNHLYILIINTLQKIDYEKYTYFYNKYNNNFREMRYNTKNLDVSDKILNKFLNEYYKYMINKTNKAVPIDTIIEAASVVKKEINGLSDEELDEWKEETIKINSDRAKNSFPYKYDPNIKKEAYLESYEGEETASHTK